MHTYIYVYACLRVDIQHTRTTANLLRPSFTSLCEHSLNVRARALVRMYCIYTRTNAHTHTHAHMHTCMYKIRVYYIYMYVYNSFSLSPSLPPSMAVSLALVVFWAFVRVPLWRTEMHMHMSPELMWPDVRRKHGPAMPNDLPYELLSRRLLTIPIAL